MAKKRALVDAVLTTTAASDIFTQDLEDISASLATLAPANPGTAAAPPTSAQASIVAVPPDASPSTPAASPAPAAPRGTSGDRNPEPLEFRHVPVHFGKNRGLTLADLTPQQLHWYETEWMPKKAVQGNAGEGDQALMAGLKAYREWREVEKRAEAGATVQRPKRRRAATRAAETTRAA